MKSYKKNILMAFLLVFVLAGCKDQWEERMELTTPTLAGTVLDQISENPELSTFHSYLQATGYDSIIASSKSFTVWAPTNEALQEIDQSLLDDTEWLKQFIGNHISFLKYFTYSPLSGHSRIETLNGKFILWQDVKDEIVTGAEGANATSDILTANGVVQVIKRALLPKKSNWEFLMQSDFGPQQRAFLASLLDSVFVPELAPKLGVDPNTGETIYDTLAGTVIRNIYFNHGYNVANEDSLSTFIILTDEAFNQELAEYRRFYNTGDDDSTHYFTSLGIIKDLAFPGMYTPDQLPATLQSKDGVEVTIDLAHVLHVEHTSNGIVYVLNNLELNPQDKLQPIIVQGESVFGPAFPEVARLNVLRLSHPERANAVRWRRRRIGDGSGQFIYDVLAYNHDRSSFYIRYPLQDVNTVAYDVYMTTYNDFNRERQYQQTVAFGEPLADDLPYVNVPAGSYERIYVGRYTVEDHGDLNMYLFGAASISDSANPLNMDYVELIPVVE